LQLTQLMLCVLLCRVLFSCPHLLLSSLHYFAAWVNALPLAEHHHVLPLVVDPSPVRLD
jgi:hypothetical protein